MFLSASCLLLFCNSRLLRSSVKLRSRRPQAQEQQYAWCYRVQTRKASARWFPGDLEPRGWQPMCRTPPPTGSATFATCFATLHQCFATFHICCAFWRFRCVCGLVFLSFSAYEHLVMLHNRQKAIKSTTKATKSTTKAIKSTTKATKTTTKARNAATHY